MKYPKVYCDCGNEIKDFIHEMEINVDGKVVTVKQDLQTIQETMMDKCVDCRNAVVDKQIETMKQMCPKLFEGFEGEE